MKLPASELPSYIAQALEEGFTQKEIADSLGCSESYISQVITANPKLQQVKQKQDGIYEDIDEMYATIELNALKELNRRMAVVTDPMQLVRIATAINAAKRRSAPKGMAIENGGNSAASVTINMPQTVMHNFQFNGNNQAVALTREDGTVERQLVTATSGQLNELSAQFATKMLAPVVEKATADRFSSLQERVKALTERRDPTADM